MTALTEAEVEIATLDWLSAIGWQVTHRSDIASDTPNAERADYGQIVLERRLRDPLSQCNPTPHCPGRYLRKPTRLPRGQPLKPATALPLQSASFAYSLQ